MRDLMGVGGLGKEEEILAEIKSSTVKSWGGRHSWDLEDKVGVLGGQMRQRCAGLGTHRSSL